LITPVRTDGENGDHLPSQSRYRSPGLYQNRKQPVDVAHPLAHDYTKLGEIGPNHQAAALVGSECRGCDGAEERLPGRQSCTKRIGPLHRFTDRFGVGGIVLLAFDVRLDELRPRLRQIPSAFNFPKMLGSYLLTMFLFLTGARPLRGKSRR
jgi:hypothetical protein